MVRWRRSASTSEPAKPLSSGNARVLPNISADSSPLAGEEEGVDEERWSALMPDLLTDILPLAGEEEGVDEERWSALMPDLLTDILRRVEAGAERWPPRRDVVACASVCRRWRDAAVAIVRPPLESGRITFPSSLKQPGPRDAPIHCFIKRNKKNSTFYLYLGLTQDEGKFLLAARRFRRGLCMEYIISIHSDGLSQGSHSYVGTLKSDFMGTKFTIYDRQQPYEGAKELSCRSDRWFASKQISPLVSTGNFEVGQVSYEYNLRRSRGPRRIHCSIQCPINEGTAVDTQEANQLSTPRSLVLNNKVPRWHGHLQCWCLNFHGRVMVASVKNFQLIAPAGNREPWGVQDDETVILQFGKIDDDVFTMDYRQPLSAFQAFAICLASFGTKLACE